MQELDEVPEFGLDEEDLEDDDFNRNPFMFEEVLFFVMCFILLICLICC